MENYRVKTNITPKIKGLSITNLTLIFVGLYLFLETLCPHTKYSQIMMVVVVFLCGLNVVSVINGKIFLTIKFNPFIICYGLFIIYQMVLYLTGVAQNSQATMDDIITMIYSFIIVLFVYSFLYKNVDFLHFEIMFVIVGVISVITVMILCKDTLGTGRMAHTYKDGISYYFLGVPVAVSSNGMASVWAIAAYFCCNLIKHSKKAFFKVVLLLFMILLAIGIALSGSRKGFLIFILCIAGYYFINSGKNVITKLLTALIICVFIYLLVIKIPVLYETLGERLEILVNNILGLSEIEEGSMSARDMYAKYALKAFNSNPLLGYGSGWFSSLYGNVTENDYYETLVSGGIIGFIIRYFFIVCALYSFFRTKKKDKKFYTYSFILVIILITMWGTVIVLSRIYLIFLSLYFLCVDKQHDRISK